VSNSCRPLPLRSPVALLSVPPILSEVRSLLRPGRFCASTVLALVPARFPYALTVSCNESFFPCLEASASFLQTRARGLGRLCFPSFAAQLDLLPDHQGPRERARCCSPWRLLPYPFFFLAGLGLPGPHFVWIPERLPPSCKLLSSALRAPLTTSFCRFYFFGRSCYLPAFHYLLCPRCRS